MNFADFQFEVNAEADKLQPQILLELWKKLESYGNGDVIGRYTSLLQSYVSLKKAIHRASKKIGEFDAYTSEYTYFSSLKSHLNLLREQLEKIQVRKYWLRVEMSAAGLDFKKFHKWIPNN